MSMTARALGRVLVVDDELGPRESLRMLLKPSYAIQTAENGRTALDLLRRFQPDVVIMYTHGSPGMCSSQYSAC